MFFFASCWTERPGLPCCSLVPFYFFLIFLEITLDDWVGSGMMTLLVEVRMYSVDYIPVGRMAATVMLRLWSQQSTTT